MHKILWLVTSNWEFQSLGMHEITTILSHRKRTLSSGFRHTRLWAKTDTKWVSSDQTLAPRHTQLRVQGTKNTLTVGNADKEPKATIRCQVHIPTKGSQTTSAPVSQMLSISSLWLKSCNKWYTSGSGGDIRRKQGRSGHHWASLLRAFFCLKQNLFCVWHRQTPPRAPVPSAGTPGICLSVHSRSSQIAMGLHSGSYHKLLCPISLPSQVKKHQPAMLQLNIQLPAPRTASCFLSWPPIGVKHWQP